MMDIKWIKICTDIFDDEKISLIENMPKNDSLIVIWFKLLCMAGKQNNNGVFILNDNIAYTDKMLAAIFHRPLNTIRIALDTFEKYGMIEIVDGVITIPNWEKHQNVDQMEKVKKQNRIRAAKHREKQKQIAGNSDGNVTVTLPITLSNATEIDIDREKDKDKDKEKEAGSKEKRERFSPPTFEDVQAYCQERNNDVDPQRFIDHYTSNGWMVGKNKMKDWKASVRTWEKREKNSVVTVEEPKTKYGGTYL